MTLNKVLVTALSCWLCCSSCQLSTRNMSSSTGLGKHQFVDEASGAVMTYTVTEQKHVDTTLVLTITTQDLDHAKEIAAQWIESKPQEQKVQMFFYRSDLIGRAKNAQVLYEWNRQQGLRLAHDLRFPLAQKMDYTDYPKYEVLNENRPLEGSVFKEILIPDLSPQTAASEIERVCQIIGYEENTANCLFYSTLDAYRANRSDSDRLTHTEALKRGYLGSIKKGVFIPIQP